MCLQTAAQASQLALYAILAVPLIMGNDLRVLSSDAKAMLLNKDVVAISQDPAARAGIRLGGLLHHANPSHILQMRAMSPLDHACDGGS
jgi:hypothetical protein